MRPHRTCNVALAVHNLLILGAHSSQLSTATRDIVGVATYKSGLGSQSWYESSPENIPTYHLGLLERSIN